MTGRLFLASCGAARLRIAADVLRADTRVTSVNGPLAAAGSDGMWKPSPPTRSLRRSRGDQRRLVHDAGRYRACDP